MLYIFDVYKRILALSDWPDTCSFTEARFSSRAVTMI